jgi:energy-coupling factor transporter transmembrane protein EcfT
MFEKVCEMWGRRKMESSRSNVGLTRIATYTILLIFLLALIGLFAVNYTAALALIVGSVLSLVVVGLRSILIKSSRRSCILASLLLFLFIVGMVTFCFILFSLFGTLPIMNAADLTCDGLEPHFRTSAKSSQIVIEQSKVSPGSFMAREQVDILQEQVECKNGHAVNVLNTDTKTVQLSDKQIESKDRGVLLKEVSFTPSLTMTFELPTGNSRIIPINTSNSQVKLRDMPQDSFYKAKDAENLTLDTYVDTQTVQWSLRNGSNGIVFAFIPTPFNILRPLVSPFLGISSWSEWLVAIIALVAGLFLQPIVAPVLSDTVKGRFKSWFDRQTTQPKTTQPTETGKLIISAKGEEKNIEIKK